MKPILSSILMFAALTAALVAAVFAQNNPVPQVVGPPHPQAVAPGGGGFTLRVYGANFVPGAVVNWNRQPRATTYISGHEVDAMILASDILGNSAGYITVTNPVPVGGSSSSSWSLVEVHTPTAKLIPRNPTRYFAGHGTVASLLIADFNNDGIPDFAADSGLVQVQLGDGEGEFRFASDATYIARTVFGTADAAFGDLNGDGNVDLVYGTESGPHGANTGFGVSLGEGGGTFKPGWQFTNSGEVYLGGSVVAGDFNRDGTLDLAVQGLPGLTIFSGYGDGTFRPSSIYANAIGFVTVLGDFDGDGILDLAILQQTSAVPTSFPISIAFGNGDGTFQKPVVITRIGSICGSGVPLLASDFNGDGKLDLAFCTDDSIGILLGKGDGTFQKPTYYLVGATTDFSFATGDFNSDGSTDLIVSHSGDNSECAILLGNGDGTFQLPEKVELPGLPNQSGEAGIAVGDFNSDGLLDFIFQLGAVGIDEYLQQ